MKNRGVQRGLIRHAACAVVTVALVAGCTSSSVTPAPSGAPVESASPDSSGQVVQAAVNAADVQPWLAGPVPGGDANGPAYPRTWPRSVVTGSGQATSLTPELVVPPEAKVSGNVRIQIVDLSAGGGFGPDGTGEATGIVLDQDGPASGFTVPADSLADGGTYAWRVRKGDRWIGPWAFAIDTVRASSAPVDTVDAVSVNVLSGIPSIQWNAPAFPGELTTLAFGAVYRPGQAPTPGLPAGWSWALPGSGLLRLEESELRASTDDTADSGGSVFGGASGPLSVTLRSATGAGLTFVRTESGAYVPGLADGTATSYSRGGVLSRMSEGVWQYATSSGSMTRFVDGYAASEWSQGVPVAEFEWDAEGRLIGVSDGLSRMLKLAYDGMGACPASSWGNGFGVAPGLWCSVTHPDGTATGIGYVADRIGLIADPGGLGIGFGWDGAGRLSAIREPGATAAAATAGGDWSSADLTTRIAYDDDGRVASVVRAAAQPGGAAVTRSYSYPAGDGEMLSARVTQAVGNKEAEEALRVEATSDRWQLLTSTTFGVLTTKNSYDEKSGVAVGGTDPQGRTTTTKLDDDALMRSSVGPFTGTPERALRTDRTLDATVVDPDAGAESRTEAWRGMSAVLWAGDVGTPQWWDERVLTERAVSGPVGTEGPWQAQASALWKVPASGEWDIEMTTSEGILAELVIDGVRCAANGPEPCRMRLKEGERSLALALSGDGRGSFRVTASRGGTDREGRRDIPLDQVRPNYNATTVVSTNDVVGQRNLSTQVYEIDRPWSQAPTTVTASGGLVTAYDYEPFDPAKSEWGRQTRTVNAGGATQTTAYYGSQEQAANPCLGGASASQAGLPREVTRYDGVTITMVYDAAGRIVSAVTKGDGASESACTTYDAAGRIIASSVTDGEGGTLESSSTAYTWEGGMLTVTSQYTVAGENYSTRTRVNVRGGTVSYADPWGTSTDFAYDDQGFLTSRTTTPPGASKPALTVEYAYDQATGNVTRVTANGTELAGVEYTEAGVPLAISYPQGIVQSFSYATSGAPDAIELASRDLTIIQRRNRNAGGRTISSSLEVRDGRTSTSAATWDYDYDEAGRLVTAQLAATGDDAPFGGKKRAFDYDYGSPKECPTKAGADLNRTGGARDGVAYVTCYDDRGRLAWTSDPALAPNGGKATATWDGLGRLTSLDARVPLTISWSTGTQAAEVTQGPDTAQMLAVGGSIIREAVGDATRRLGYTDPESPLPGVIMDDAGAVTGLLVGLPGGGIAYLDPSAALQSVQYPDIFLGTLATSDAQGTVALERQFGPYGEPLVSAETGQSAYAWQSAPRNPTLAGPHELTFSARPYSPWLGAFLAFDPLPGASPTGYGYGDGNPLDSPDTSGGASGWDIAAIVLGGIATVMGVAAGKAARSQWIGGDDYVLGRAYQYVLGGAAALASTIVLTRGIVMAASGNNQGADGVWFASAFVTLAGVISAGVGLGRWDDQVWKGMEERRQARMSISTVGEQVQQVADEVTIDGALEKSYSRQSSYDLDAAFRANFD